MPEPTGDRFNQDKAIVMSILKYVLIAVLLGAAGFVGLKLFWLLIPFIIGFVLAKTSSSLSLSTLLLLRRLRRKKRSPEVSPDGDEDPSALETKIDDSPEISPGSRSLPLFLRGRASRKSASVAPKDKKSPGMVLSIVIFALMLLSLVGLIVLIIVIGAAQIKTLADKLPLVFSSESINNLLDSLKSLSGRLGGFLPESAITAIEDELYSLQQLALKQVPVVATALLNFILAMISDLPVFFFMVVVVIVSGYYFLTEKRSVREFLKRNIPSESFIMNSVQLVNRLFITLFRTIGGYFLLLIITYVLALVALVAIRMPYAVIIALAAAVLDFLPVLGLSATFIPVAIYMGVTGSVYGMIGAIVALAGMTVIRRFIEPPILGSALRMHPMATLFSMVLGLGIFGLTGFLLGPVLTVVVTETLTQFHFDRKLRTWFGHLLDKVSEN